MKAITSEGGGCVGLAVGFGVSPDVGFGIGVAVAVGVGDGAVGNRDTNAVGVSVGREGFVGLLCVTDVASVF